MGGTVRIGVENGAVAVTVGLEGAARRTVGIEGKRFYSFPG